MEEIFPTLIIGFVGMALVVWLTANAARVEANFLRASYLIHAMASVSLLWIMDHVFITSDVHGYLRIGSIVARLLRDDVFHWAPEVAKQLFGLTSELPVDFFGNDSTSRMRIVTGIGLCLCGDSEYGTNLLFGILSFFGKMVLYRGIRDHLPTIARERLLLSTTLVPSVVFWSSGIVKETFATTGIGFFLFGFSAMLVKRPARAVAPCIAGTLLIAGFKAFLLFPLALACAAWYILHRLRTSGRSAVPLVRPIYVVLAAVVAIASVSALGVLFPSFSLEHVSETATMQRVHGAEAAGGSYYSIGDPEARGIGAQLAITPLALFTVLARPFLFEARNVTMFIAAIEMTVLFALLARAIYIRSLRTIWNDVKSSPVLVFCLSFTVLAGTAIGVATTNFGSLSRYRIPLMPFYVLLVLALLAPRRAKHAADLRQLSGTRVSLTRQSDSGQTVSESA